MLHVDQDLFAAAQAGDRAALERLLAQLQPDIHRYARFQCYASSSIEDVVQEALIVVYRRVGGIRSPAALGAWLVRVVAKSLVRRARAAVRHNLTPRARKDAS